MRELEETKAGEIYGPLPHVRDAQYTNAAK